MGGDIEKIQVVGRYFIEVWKAAGMVFIKIISCLKCSRGSSLKIIWMNDSRKRFIDKKILLT